MIETRIYTPDDLEQMCAIWNEVVEEGRAFPQMEALDTISAKSFFSQQSVSCVAEKGNRILGLYIIHPNNVGRCSHVANGSYAVSSYARGKGIGRILVQDSLARCERLGFRGLQFNAVVDSNWGARRLYEDIGFSHRGTIPGGFLLKEGNYVDTHIYYYDLT